MLHHPFEQPLSRGLEPRTKLSSPLEQTLNHEPETDRYKAGQRPQLSAEEKARRLAEMQQDAARNDTRRLQASPKP